MHPRATIIRRVLCWTPEDTAYPLRKDSRSASQDLSKETIAAIKEFSWADDLIYTVFNSTLHSSISREINFQVEVEQLRKDRAQVAQRCQKSAKMTDGMRLDAMRALWQKKKGVHYAADLLNNDHDFQCHTAYLSTAGFAAFFKTIWSMGGGTSPIAPDNTFNKDLLPKDGTKVRAAKNFKKVARSLDAGGGGGGGGGGAAVAAATADVIDPNSVDAPPPKPGQACAAQKFIYLKTHKTGSSTILSILHRYSFKYQLNSALPIDNMYLGWPTRKGALHSFTEIRGVQDYDVFASGHSTWSHNYIREIVPVGKQITIFREPVSQFVSSWNHWHPYEHIVGMGGPDLTMSQFLDAPSKYVGAPRGPLHRWVAPRGGEGRFCFFNTDVRSILMV